MILQYKGYKNNWVYEEAETITYAVVWVGKVTGNDYCQDNIKYKNKKKSNQDDLDYVKKIHEAVDDVIREETHCGNGEIVYHIDKPFDQMKNVTVVMLNDKNKSITRVFESGVYLLNNRGQTIQKLA